MPSLLEILQDPNYVNANQATKEAIFNKYSAQDTNFTEANEATKSAIRQRFGLSSLGAPEEDTTKDTGFFDMAGRALVRGGKQTASLLGDVLPAMVAKGFGADEYAAKQMEEAKATQEEIAKKYAPRYGELADVKGISDILPFITETVLEQVPNLATAIVPGVGGAAVGSRLAAGQLGKSALARGATEEAAKRYATRYGAEAAITGASRGALGGAFLGSYALNAPEIFQNIEEETGQMEVGASLLAGSVAAALDSVLPAALVKQFTPGMKAGVVEKILERSGMPAGVARGAAAGVITGAATEAPTEAAQEAISIAAEKFVQENAPAWGSKEFNRLIEAGVRGGVGGGGISGVAGGAKGYLEKRAARAEPAVAPAAPGKTAFDEFEEETAPATVAPAEQDLDIPLGEPAPIPTLTAEEIDGLKGLATQQLGREPTVDELDGLVNALVRAKIREQTPEDLYGESREPVDRTREPSVSVPSGVEAGVAPAGVVGPEQRGLGVPSEAAPDVGGRAKPVGAALTQDALDLLKSVDEGGTPAFMTNNLRRIAKENGVDTANKTPNDVIEALRAKLTQSSETLRAPEQMGLPLTEATAETERALPKSLVEEGEAFELERPAGVAPKVSEVITEETPAVGAPLRMVGKTPDRLFSFLKNIKPVAQAETGVKNHQNSVNAFVDEINEFIDPRLVTQEERRDNLAAINEFFDSQSLASDPKAAGEFASMMQGRTSAEQAQLIGSRTRMPNLTRLEGINELRTKFKDFMSRRSAETLGYTERQAALETFGKDARVPPRVSEIGRRLKQTSPKSRTKEEQAAVNYFSQWSYGMAMRSAAFDLAVGTPDGEMFSGQGAKQAEIFRTYIEENFPAEVSFAFNNLVNLYKADYRKAVRAAKSFAAKQKHIKAVQKFSAMTYEQAESELRKAVFGSNPLANFKPLHPSVMSRVEAGDFTGALSAVAQNTNNKYYGALARRISEIPGIENVSIGVDNQALLVELELEKVRPSLNKFLDYIQIAYPQVYNDVFLGTQNNPKRLLEGLKKVKDDNLMDAAVFENEAYKNVLKTYEEIVPSLNAPGTYFLGPDAISLNTNRGGASYYVFFHEAVHAATAKVIRNRDALNPQQKKALDNLNKLYEFAAKDSSISAYGFTSLDEFIAEAYSNPEFQSLLRSMKYENTQQSLWSKFIEFVAQLLGATNNVLFNTLVNADIIMSGPRGNNVITGSLNATATKTKSALDGSWKTAPDVKNAKQWLESALTKNNWASVKKNMPKFLETLTDTMRQHYLGAFTLRQLKDLIGNRLGDSTQNFIDTVERLLDDRNTILQRVSEITKKWELFQSNFPEKARILANTMIDATLKGIDPAVDAKGDVALQNAWDSLGPEGQEIYTAVRDFYEQRLKAYRGTILENVRLSMIANNKSQAEITATLDELKQKFDKDTIKPYFPLKRFGKYWLQVGKGKDKEFYLFESAGARNAFRRELQADPAYATKDFDEGNNLSRLVNQNISDLNTLKSLKDIVDNATGGDVQDLKNNIQDSLEQMYLLTLPDKSARKMFINRKQVAGASQDMLRAFTVSSFHMAYQNSRFEHARGLYNQINAARGYIEGKPLDERKADRDYINELEKRLQYIMNPTDTGLIPSILSNVSFVWYLTAPASAIVNMMGVPAIGLPVIAARFGWGKSSAALGAYSKRFMGTGFKDGDGKLDFPTLGRANLTDLERRAYDKFVADGLIDVTLSHDLAGMAEAPTNLYTGKTHKVMRVLSAAFHNAEKFNREVMSMATFQMAYEAAIKKGLTGDAAFNEAINVSKDLTYRSMFDYSTLNKPRYFQNSYAKVILQFKQFSQQMTYLLARSVFEAAAGESPEVRAEAKKRLMGTLGMAFLFAGASGMPLFSAMSAVIESVYAAFADDDEPPLDFENWFKNWMAETFGNFWGDSISRGLFTQASGMNFADRMSLNDLWFRDARKSQDEVTALQNMLFNLLGPTAALTISGAEAVKLFNDGHYYRAAEKAAPAFLRQPLVGARYASEGALTLRGDDLVSDISPKEALTQALGFSPERVAQKQKANIEMKTAEQEVINKRQDLLNAFFMAIDTGDSDYADRIFEKINRFNRMYPGYPITGETLQKSVREKYRRRAEAEITGGMPINKNLLPQLGGMGAYGETR